MQRLRGIIACVQASVSPTQAAPAGTDAVARDLGALVKLLLTGTNSEFFATVERLGLSFTQVKTLGVLREAEAPLTVKALSDLLGLSLPAVSRAVETLVRRGEVRREEDLEDRRCKNVDLTAKGRRTFDQLAARRMAGITNFVEGMDPSEREALAAALRPIVERTRS
jgi:DNA-binding MarR family transcriptional regulator